MKEPTVVSAGASLIQSNGKTDNDRGHRGLNGLCPQPPSSCFKQRKMKDKASNRIATVPTQFGAIWNGAWGKLMPRYFFPFLNIQSAERVGKVCWQLGVQRLIVHKMTVYRWSPKATVASQDTVSVWSRQCKEWHTAVAAHVHWSDVFLLS